MKLGTWKCTFASDFSVLNNILICNCLVLVQSYIASAKRYLVEQKILIWLACLVAIFWIVFSNSFFESMAILRVLQKKQNYEKGHRHNWGGLLILAIFCTGRSHINFRRFSYDKRCNNGFKCSKNAQFHTDFSKNFLGGSGPPDPP